MEWLESESGADMTQIHSSTEVLYWVHSSIHSLVNSYGMPIIYQGMCPPQCIYSLLVLYIILTCNEDW